MMGNTDDLERYTVWG